MNPVLESIVRTGETVLEDGSRVKVDSQIDPACGALLQRAIRSVKARVACEVGLAFGISTLYMLEALVENEGTLIGMDPAQHDGHWRGGGLANVRAAGFGARYRFHEEASQIVLPRLTREGTRIQVGFIDGWHTFDHTLVDFFFLDRMLEPGGILVFDDAGYPAIRRVCEFVITNRAYELWDCVDLPTASAGVRLRRSAKKLQIAAVSRMTQTDKTPSPAARQTESRIENAYFAAFRKVRDDDRRFDHFAAF